MVQKRTAAKKVVLGMSGGVDSSVSLMLLKKAGHEVIGVSLKYKTYNRKKLKENVCCSKKSLDLVRRICRSFGVKHVILNVENEFQKEIIDYFKNELKLNRTPSPCIFCNPKVKFKTLFSYCQKIGFDFVSTGHYARIKEDFFGGKKQFLLCKSKDKNKDQTYSLSFLSRDLLPRIIFPLGDLSKEEVYSLAKDHDILKTYASVKQSQDFCFLSNNEYGEFIKREIKPIAGKIIDGNGKTLGYHEGLNYYTLGQRKGIKLAGGPYYVVEKKSPSTLIVSKDIGLSFKRNVVLKPINLLAQIRRNEIEVKVKSRSSAKLFKAKIRIHRDYIELSYAKPHSTLVAGQIAAFYHKEVCLGSGVINC